ncbi:MAG: hypothetical protein D6705_00265 [Deltaproteobacteria bacterium]|nr:MAG: hypothetical protein D6705_00265 [Deltaproteobacteria bacterium]
MTCGDISDAFCTISNCSNPALDCDPSPGGTATPICVPNGASSFCALDCSNGKTCPTGMTCYNVTVAMICA